MQPRFLGRLGLADAVTAANAALGFAAVVIAATDPSAAARLVLLAAIADGLDGVLARIRGGTAVGPHLDSLADVASFGVAPAALVYAVITAEVPGSRLATVTLFAAALYVAMAVVRLGFYMLDDGDRPETEGVQTTLSATVIAATQLSGLATPVVLVGLLAFFTYLMVAPITYPDLYARDAVVLGGLQVLAIAFPTVGGRVLPRSLLVFAVAYLLLSPFLYWREPDKE